jgi:hypothetical protein
MREDSLDKFEECTIRSRSISVKESANLTRKIREKTERMQRQTQEIMEKKRRRKVENEMARKQREEKDFKKYCTFKPKVNAPGSFKAKLRRDDEQDKVKGNFFL